MSNKDELIKNRDELLKRRYKTSEQVDKLRGQYLSNLNEIHKEMIKEKKTNERKHTLGVLMVAIAIGLGLFGAIKLAPAGGSKMLITIVVVVFIAVIAAVVFMTAASKRSSEAGEAAEKFKTAINKIREGTVE